VARHPLALFRVGTPLDALSRRAEEVQQRARVNRADVAGAVEFGREQVHHPFGEIAQPVVTPHREGHHRDARRLAGGFRPVAPAPDRLRERAGLR
jgi:hypothetical protein